MDELLYYPFHVTGKNTTMDKFGFINIDFNNKSVFSSNTCKYDNNIPSCGIESFIADTDITIKMSKVNKLYKDIISGIEKEYPYLSEECNNWYDFFNKLCLYNREQDCVDNLSSFDTLPNFEKLFFEHKIEY